MAIVGHPEAQAREAVAALVRQLGLQAVPAEGDLWQRLKRQGDLDYAIMLLPAAAADAGASMLKVLSAERVLELGSVLAQVDRRRVCLLGLGPNAKAPAWEGLAGLAMDDGNLWHLLLARAMKQAGLDVDLNRAL